MALAVAPQVGAGMAIDKATVYIARKMSTIPWKGKVVLVKEDGTVFVNSGANTNVKVGDSFSVFREGEALIDPDTGIELGKDTSKIAEISIFEVQEKFSKAKIDDKTSDIAKGDLMLE